MKLNYIILALSALTVSCSPQFDITDHFDPNLPIKVIDQYPPSPIRTFEISKDDPRHAKLASWLKSNNDGWKKTDHDTHAGLIIVRQDDFVILLYKDNDMVIAGYDAVGNDMKQYKRVMDSNELMFIVNE